MFPIDAGEVVAVIEARILNDLFETDVRIRSPGILDMLKATFQKQFLEGCFISIPQGMGKRRDASAHMARHIGNIDVLTVMLVDEFSGFVNQVISSEANEFSAQNVVGKKLQQSR